MRLYTDIPSQPEIGRLFEQNGRPSVSIYLPTSRTSRGDAERIEFENLAAEAISQLEGGDVDKHQVAAIREELADLADDADFWSHQARSLAVFATPESVTSFRLPNHLVAIVEVSDRLHLKPLLRSITFPNHALVMALSQNGVRVIEISEDGDAAEVRVADMPTDIANASGKASITDRSPSRRLQGSEGQKVRMVQYARQVDHALRPLVTGHTTPLILAATEPLDAIYRSVSSYPHLAAESISGNPDTTSDADLVARAREVLDRLHAADLAQVRDTFAHRASQSRASTDLSDVARAATYGLVDTLLVDIDDVVPGTIDETSGEITFGGADAVNYGVTDEVARRVWLSDGRVLAVRREDIPGDTGIAAILRYPI